MFKRNSNDARKSRRELSAENKKLHEELEQETKRREQFESEASRLINSFRLETIYHRRQFSESPEYNHTTHSVCSGAYTVERIWQYFGYGTQLNIPAHIIEIDDDHALIFHADISMRSSEGALILNRLYRFIHRWIDEFGVPDIDTTTRMLSVLNEDLYRIRYPGYFSSGGMMLLSSTTNEILWHNFGWNKIEVHPVSRQKRSVIEGTCTPSLGALSEELFGQPISWPGDIFTIDEQDMIVQIIRGFDENDAFYMSQDFGYWNEYPEDFRRKQADKSWPVLNEIMINMYGNHDIEVDRGPLAYVQRFFFSQLPINLSMADRIYLTATALNVYDPTNPEFQKITQKYSHPKNLPLRIPLHLAPFFCQLTGIDENQWIQEDGTAYAEHPRLRLSGPQYPILAIRKNPVSSQEVEPSLRNFPYNPDHHGEPEEQSGTRNYFPRILDFSDSYAELHQQMEDIQRIKQRLEDARKAQQERERDIILTPAPPKYYVEDMEDVEELEEVEDASIGGLELSLEVGEGEGIGELEELDGLEGIEDIDSGDF